MVPSMPDTRHSHHQSLGDMRIATLFGLLGLTSLVTATGPIPVTRTGLAGIAGFTFYDPYCAVGCFRSFSPYTLECSSEIHAGGHTTSSDNAHNLAICRASSFPFLSSVAWCIHTWCPDHVRASTIEKFWGTSLTGDVKVRPEWTYGETLAKITTPPTMLAMDDGMVLNMTMRTTYDTWKVTQDTLIYFFRETALESYYGLSLLLAGFGTPIVLTWLGYLPFVTSLLARAKPWILYPSIFGTYHNRPLPFLLGNAPTLGHSLYIGMILFLNIVFLTVGYATLYPNEVFQWYTNHYQELLAYWMWRTGALAFCQMPLLFLFSTRNNVLMWLTNWSHSTYMLLHRWISRFFLLQTLLHSIISLVLYVDDGYYASELDTKLWIWGCVATVAAVILVLASVLIIRQQTYELFLISHIVLAVILLVGSWYHVWADDPGDFGYETFLYATFAVWGFDRLARLGRIWKTGIRRARVTDINSTIARVDISGVRWAEPGRCVFVYFPTLHPLRPWENHPFSTIPTSLINEARCGEQAASDHGDLEKNHAVAVGSQVAANSEAYTTAGLTLFVRKRGGVTKHLKAQENVLTLLDGPYPTNPTKSILRSDRLLLVGGGIGITGLLPFLACHPNIKLFFGAKAEDEALVACLRNVLDRVHEREIRVGRRLDINSLLRNEASRGWTKIGVVVCGPAAMCDNTRAIVGRIGREVRGMCTIELEVDTFTW